MVELGRKLYAADLLEQPRNIFYLEVEESLGFVTGTATTTDLRGWWHCARRSSSATVRCRRPPDRFETHGAVHHGNNFQGKAAPPKTSKRRPAQGPWLLSGDRARPGAWSSPIRATPRLHSGDILVAERTDPGWIMLFPSAAGLLVERGSLLSHSAIVAREMGIPADGVAGGRDALAEGWRSRRVGRRHRHRAADQQIACGLCKSRRASHHVTPLTCALLRCRGKSEERPARLCSPPL